MSGTTSIRATETGVELRQGRNTVHVYRHQIAPFTEYATAWVEQLHRKGQ